MNQLVPFRSSTPPELVAAAGERASIFTANIRNPHTRRAYARGIPYGLSRRRPATRRSQRAAIPHDRARHRQVPTRTVLSQANAYAMIGRRAAAAGIATNLGNHSFRATGITAYLKNGGTLEKAAAMANHASTRTTQLYDRRRDEVSLDEVERIVI
jgi:integrase